VQAAITELDYRPQTAARGLRGRTYALGVLIPDIRNPFFPDILDAAAGWLRQTQYKFFLGVGHSELQTEHALVDWMIDTKMDGVILTAPRIERDQLSTLAHAIPTVVIGRHEAGSGYDTVNNNDFAGAQLAVDHLAALGHTRIAHLALEFAEDYSASVNINRQRGFVARMEELGLVPRVVVRGGTWIDDGRAAAMDVLSRPGKPTMFAPVADDGHAAAHEVLSQDDRPTAIFAWTDNVAIGVLSTAADLGLRIPEDLSVVGYDNSRVCDIAQISLTSVDQSAHLLGETAARLLLERIEGRTEEVHFVAAPKLVVRGSTGAPGA
jgi:DNA-binding LacI/PurR family transcriptional regulator